MSHSVSQPPPRYHTKVPETTLFHVTPYRARSKPSRVQEMPMKWALSAGRRPLTLRIDDLEGRARHRHRGIVTAFDHEFARTNARCDSYAVDRERKRAGQDRAHRPNGREIGTEIRGLASLGDLSLGHA